MENQNQNRGAGQHTINIQVPSVDNIASKRPLIPSFFALAIIFFFLTFCVFKCGGQKIGSATGLNLVTGTELANRDLMTGRETKGQEIPANIWAIFAFGAAIIGFGAFMIKDKREALIGTSAGAIGVGSLIILQLVIKNAIDEEAKGGIDVDFQFPYWGALIALAIAGIISYLRMQKTPNILVSGSPPSTTTTPAIENNSQSQTIFSSILPTIKDIASSFSNIQFYMLPIKLQDTRSGQILPLNGLNVSGYYHATIGRKVLTGKEAAAHIKIPNDFSTISGIHAEFFYKDGVTTLKNKSQTNPTEHNGIQLGADQTVILSIGDLIKMGTIEFKVI
jgi:hypothetical protein